MGYFYNKFLEAADLTSVQTPDDIGNDLEQIWKDIEGSDGIAVDKDELEDVWSGLVGDPVDECMIMIAEGTHNWNEFMKGIGYSELHEYQNNIVHEEQKVQKDNIIKRFINWIGERLKDIGKFFTAFINKFKSIINRNRSDIKNNEDKIEDGFKNGNYSFEAPDIEKIEDRLVEIDQNIQEAYRKFSKGNSIGSNESDIIYTICGINADSTTDLQSKLNSIEFENRTYTNNDNKSIYTRCRLNAMNYDKIVSSAQESFKTMKDAMNIIIDYEKDELNKNKDSYDVINNNINRDIIVVNTVTVLFSYELKLYKLIYDASCGILNAWKSVSNNK